MVVPSKKVARGVSLTGLFADAESAERAIQACVIRGHEVGDVNVVVSEGTRKRLLADRDEPEANLVKREREGAELGGPSGGRVGILVTIFAAVGAAIAIPARQSAGTPASPSSSICTEWMHASWCASDSSSPVARLRARTTIAPSPVAAT